MTKIEKRKEKIAKSSFAVQGRAGKLTQKGKAKRKRKAREGTGKVRKRGRNLSTEIFLKLKIWRSRAE